MDLQRKPEWLRKKIDFGATQTTAALLGGLSLNTICQEARCPNISECFRASHATFLILGHACTRACAFCNVTKARPQGLNPDEPKKVAEAASRLRLKHVVVTSVTRDDLPHGGAEIFSATVLEIRKTLPQATIELLIPDFQEDKTALQAIIKSSPDILGHNVETVPRLYHLRPGADYQRSLAVLRYTKIENPGMRTKSALLLGFGEREKEVIETLGDLKKAGCDYLALGQYLRPSLAHAQVKKYVTPEQFAEYKKTALSLGFLHVESAPYVRSSWQAGEYLRSPVPDAPAR